MQLPGSVTIPAGQSSTAVTVTPIDNGIGSGGTVVLALAADPNLQYYLSNPLGSATVTIDNSNEPLANWKFDSGTAANSGSGTNLDGTLENGVTISTTGGIVGGGLTLSGNQYVDVPYNSTMNSELSFGTGGFTLSAWVKLASTDNFTNSHTRSSPSAVTVPP